MEVAETSIAFGFIIGAFYKFPVLKDVKLNSNNMSSFVNSGLYSNLLDGRSVTMPALLPLSRQVSSKYPL